MNIADVRRMFKTSFFDKNEVRMKEGDYISVTSTRKMNNHYYDGLYGGIYRNIEPYREWDVTGTVIYLIKWSGDCLCADRVQELGEPHPSLSTGFHYLNSVFDAGKYEIIGNKHSGFRL